MYNVLMPFAHFVNLLFGEWQKIKGIFWVTEKVEFLNIGQSNCPLQKTPDSPFRTQTHQLKLFSKHKHFPSNHHFLLQGT